MKNGFYKYEDRPECGFTTNVGEIIIKVTETAKSYVFELIKNDMRFSPAHIDMLFKNSKKAKIAKEKSPHAIMLWSDGDFTIYPFRFGIPFWFEYIEFQNEERRENE